MTTEPLYYNTCTNCNMLHAMKGLLCPECQHEKILELHPELRRGKEEEAPDA